MADYVDITVLFFAKAKDLSGVRKSNLRVKTKISYAELKRIVCEQFGLEIIKDNFLLALNEVYCGEEDQLVIKNKDELAIVPPLSAG